MKNLLLKIERFLFYLLIFSLPFQTRVILFNSGIEWTSVFLWFSDILVIGILFLWILREINEAKINPAAPHEKTQSIFPARKSLFGSRARSSSDFKVGGNHARSPSETLFSVVRLGLPALLLCAFFIISGLSLIVAQNVEIGIYQLIKLAEFILLFFYLKFNFRRLFNFQRFLQILVASGIFQAIIAIGQFALQRNLGLKFLGESPLGPNVSGVAKTLSGGVKMIRAYGTFPSPNVLAAFLLFSIFALYLLFLSSKKKSLSFYILHSIFYIFLVWALFLTFSRTVLIIFFIFSLIFFLILFIFKNFKAVIKKTKPIYLFFLLTACLLLFVANFWPEVSFRFIPDMEEQSFQYRLSDIDRGFNFIKENPFLGIGIGNYISLFIDKYPNLLPWQYQPLHNIYLLIASETGLAGLLLFLGFLFLIFQKRLRRLKNNINFACSAGRQGFWILGLGFLLIMFFDHYFWTLQQGRLMLWILLGILVSTLRK